MDTLSTALDGQRARGASLLRCEMRAPWALRVEDGAALGLIDMVRGEAALVLRSGDPVQLRAGDIALVRGTHPYVFADAPETAPMAVIEPGNTCRSLSGEPLVTTLGLGTRTWGNAGGEDSGKGDGTGDKDGGGGGNGADATFLTASWQLAGQVTGRLVEALPDVAIVRRGQADPALTELLAREVVRDLPGQDVVLDRLVDLVLVDTVRQWFARPDIAPPSWWVAGSDPLVGRALALVHDDPARAWTLDGLAAEVHVSRATLSRRFTELVGQSPMAYVAQWRLARGADLLRAGDLSVGEVARQIGYTNPFAFSVAFKREHGRSPRAFRAAQTGVGK
jgi:AraC-like DNA-binding protein